MEALRFVSCFGKTYQRVVKRTGKKNLRCFPACCPTGHNPDSFCGGSVVAQMPASALIALTCPGAAKEAVDEKVLREEVSLILAFAEISEQTEKEPRYRVGDAVIDGRWAYAQAPSMKKKGGKVKPESSEIENPKFLLSPNLIRTRENPNGPLLQASCQIIAPKNKASTYQFEINSEHEAWHYPWSANRRTTNNLHVMRLFLFRKKSEQEFVCFEIAESTPFLIISSRPSAQAKKLQSIQSKGRKRCETDDGSSNSCSDETTPDEGSLPVREKKRLNRGRSLERHSRESVGMVSLSSDGAQVSDNFRESESPTRRKTKCFYRLVEALVYGNYEKPSDVGSIKADFAGPMNYNTSANPTSSPNLDGFSSVLLGEIVSGSDFDFGEIFKNFDDDLTLLAGQAKPPRPAVNENARAYFARDLADYLFNEKHFTDDLSIFFRDCHNNSQEDPYKDPGIGRVFKKFTKIVLDNIEGFLISRNITFEELEKKLAILPSNTASGTDLKNVEPSQRFQDHIQSLRSGLLKSIQKRPYPELFEDKSIPPLDENINIEGSWIYIGEDDGEEEVVNRLNAKGFPGFLLKIVRRSATKLQISINRDWMMMQGTEKLGPHVQYAFSLDGNIHTWAFPQFVPFAAQREAFYTAYVDKKRECIFLDQFGKMISDPDKVIHWIREVKLSSDRIEMFISTRIEIISTSTGQKELIGALFNPYLRLWGPEDSTVLAAGGGGGGATTDNVEIYSTI